MKPAQIIQLLLAVLNNLPELESDGESMVQALKQIFTSATPPTGPALLALLQQAQATDAQIEGGGESDAVAPVAPEVPAPSEPSLLD